MGESVENRRGEATEIGDDGGDGVRRWGSVEARFGKKSKDVWMRRIESCSPEQFFYECSEADDKGCS